ncbi:MAG: hypothetical protein K0Q95_2200 [Bacteroidota bacterium]|jgi:hypothetical protein|nr:hypothetical protein [Bacteroidota bacterium]
MKNNCSKYLFPLTLTILVLVSSCTKKEKDPLEKYGPFVQTVMRIDSGAFRGINFGESITSVIAKEGANTTEADTNYLYYEFSIDTMGTFDVTYDFDNGGLAEVQSFVFIKNLNQVDSVFDSFKAYFNDHYGAGDTQMGYNVWTVKSEKYGDININLSDESADFTADKTPGKISISIYPSKE